MPDIGWQPLPPCGTKPRPYGVGPYGVGPYSRYGQNVWVPWQCSDDTAAPWQPAPPVSSAAWVPWEPCDA